MAFSRAKADTFFAGQIAEKRFQLGGDPTDVGQKKGIVHGNVRLGFVDDDQAPENFVGMIVVPDDGTVIGPIDLPFELTCELPCLVRVWPESAPAAHRKVVATVSVPPMKHRWAATRRVILQHAELAVPAVATAIPQWVHSISCCEVDAAVTLFDATGAVLCAWTGPFVDVPRPRLAVLAATTSLTDVPILFSYES